MTSGEDTGDIGRVLGMKCVPVCHGMFIEKG